MIKLIELRCVISLIWYKLYRPHTRNAQPWLTQVCRYCKLTSVSPRGPLTHRAAKCVFTKQLGVSSLQDTWITSVEQCRWILQFYYVFFFMFETLSPFTTIAWEITAMPFPCETPSVSCGLKKLHLTLHQHEGEKVMTEFSFVVELSL